ncbi:uncharacterized protein PG986_001026 [Apiospora aurea]|uniref:Uncharacterized protein n=1 Tax=Apiospora aurea TaxID=335848 RepID=A0ABR1QVV4_9PEZI
MCIKHYVGYHCGHRDPEGTVMKPEYCRRPYRYDHEPACDAFVYKVHVHVDVNRPRDSDFCPACREVRGEVWKEWAATYARWNQEHIVPVREQNSTHKRMENSFKFVELKSKHAAFRLGPDHTAQELYRKLQNEILQPIEAQARRIRAAHYAWNSRMAMAKEEGLVPAGFLDVLESQRQKNRDVITMAPHSVSLFLERQAQLFDQLKVEEDKVNN